MDEPAPYLFQNYLLSFISHKMASAAFRGQHAVLDLHSEITADCGFRVTIG
jgi:hypothetical protein